jgi:hypothetical protein
VPVGSEIAAVDAVQAHVGVAATEAVARRREFDTELRAEGGGVVDGEAALQHEARVAEPAIGRAVRIALAHDRVAADANAPVGRERQLERVRQGLPTRGIDRVGRLHAGLDLEPARCGQGRGAGDAGAVRRDGGDVVGGGVGGEGAASECRRKSGTTRKRQVGGGGGEGKKSHAGDYAALLAGFRAILFGGAREKYSPVKDLRRTRDTHVPS